MRAKYAPALLTREGKWDKHNNITNNYLMIYHWGNFYDCYEDDGIILSYLFDYKLRKGNRCSFPVSILNKITNKLEDERINYQILYKDRDNIKKSFGNFNKYNDAFIKAFKYVNIKSRVDWINRKVMEIDDIAIIEKIMEFIANELRRR